ncbi:MAG: hypothetical protein ACP5PQ_03705 [Thermoproteota archaeon]
MRRIINWGGKKIGMWFTRLHNHVFHAIETGVSDQEVDETVLPKNLLQEVEQVLKNQYVEGTIFLFGKKKDGKLLYRALGSVQVVIPGKTACAR